VNDGPAFVPIETLCFVLGTRAGLFTFGGGDCFMVEIEWRTVDNDEPIHTVFVYEIDDELLDHFEMSTLKLREYLEDL
jgi:hypothetical protein